MEIQILIFVVICAVVINIPFGYWRLGTKKFSVAWFASVHLPIPLIAALRYYSHLGWHLWSFPFVAGAYFTGQYCGGFIRRRRMAHSHT